MTSPLEQSGALPKIPLGFHGETQGHGNDIGSRARIRADQGFPPSSDWRLGKWIGLPAFKPAWLIDKEKIDTNEGDS